MSPLYLKETKEEKRVNLGVGLRYLKADVPMMKKRTKPSMEASRDTETERSSPRRGAKKVGDDEERRQRGTDFLKMRNGWGPTLCSDGKAAGGEELRRRRIAGKGKGPK